MKTKEKAKQLAYIVWINLFIGIYNIYIYQQDNTMFNLTIGIFNLGVWVFLRNNQLRIAYLKKKN